MQQFSTFPLGWTPCSPKEIRLNQRNYICFIVSSKKNQNANQHDSLIFLFSAQPAQKTSNKLLGPLIRG